MCINIPKRVVQIHGNVATMEDGRVVRLALLQDVCIGDHLEVYGDIALSKLEKQKSKKLIQKKEHI